MKLHHSISCLVGILVASIIITEAFASWEDNSWEPMKESMLQRRDTENNDKPQQETQAEGRNYQQQQQLQQDETLSNDTDINAIIEQIINSRREGRNLNEYDQLYADGNIDQALNDGNDMQARNLIRDKLCGLGLMSCDVEEKRPYYSTIYAQGPPPPNFGGGPYGPPRPMPPPNHFNSRPPPPPPNSLNSYGPPRKVGYEGPFKPNYRPQGPGPVYNGPYLENPPPSAIDGSNGPTFSKPPPGAIIYGSKPPGPIFQSGNGDAPPHQGGSPPYQFENAAVEKIQASSSQQNNFYSHKPSSSILPNVQSLQSLQGLQGPGSASAASNKFVVGSLPPPLATPAGLQQHVHHHFHHVEGGDAVGSKIPTVPIPIGAGQTVNTDFSALAQSSTAFTPSIGQGGFSQSPAYTAGFNGASQGNLLSQSFTGFNSFKKPNGDLYKPAAGLASVGGIYQSGQPEINEYEQTGFGQQSSSGSYHSQNPNYYKKELHNTGGISVSNNYNGLSSGYDAGGFETARQQIVDCQCVPYNQCPAADRIGRKEDLILPIDPRNLGKNIEALSEEATSNSTSNAEAKSDQENAETNAADMKSEDEAARQKRQTDDANNTRGDVPVDSEGRQINQQTLQNLLPAIQAIELIQRKILPTYGISFGLPNPRPPAGYPTNALGDYYPAQNPYFGSLGPDGLNLGLVNVNPLVSVQVAKTDYGENVVKPLVNLHVTPNANIWESVSNLFKPRPEYIHSTHYHQHDHFSSHEHDHHEHAPHIISEPVIHNTFTGPGAVIEMVHSKPIFEYHSTSGVSPPIGTPIHLHYESGSSSLPSLGLGSYTSYSQLPQYYQGAVDGTTSTLTSYPQLTSTTSVINSNAYTAENLGHSLQGFGQGQQVFGQAINGFGQSQEIGQGQQAFGQIVNGVGQSQEIGQGQQAFGQIVNGVGQSQEIAANLGTHGYGFSGTTGGDYNFYERSENVNKPLILNATTAGSSNYEVVSLNQNRRGKELNIHTIPPQAPGAAEGSSRITFPRDRKKRFIAGHAKTAAEVASEKVTERSAKAEQRAYYGNRPVEQTCRVNEVCCRRPFRPPQQQQQPQYGRCGVRNAAGITGRIKNPIYVDGDSEFGEYPWHVAILKKDPKESIYACGGTLIDGLHVITAAHCIKSQNGFDLRVRLGEWDVNHDVEFFPYIERDVVSVHIHPEYYAGTLDNDLAILKIDHPVDFTKNPHISPACLPDKFSDFTGARCWTTGWGKDAFGEHGKYQNILKEVDVPILGHQQCESQLRQTRLGYSYKLNPGFICAGGEEGKDACKGDGGGPLVCERNGIWNVVGVVSWGIGCGQTNVPGVYVRVAHYLDWIRQITQYYK